MRISPVRTLAVAGFALLYLGCGGGGEPAGPGDDDSTTGSIRVEVTTGGEDVDPDGYQVVLGDEDRATDVTVNGTATLSGVSPGQYTVSLEEVAVNCPVSGGTDRDVSVSAGDQSSVSFDITCESAPGIVFVWARDADPGIYTAKVNGADVELVAADEWGIAEPNTLQEIVPSPDGTRAVFVTEDDVVILLDLGTGEWQALPQSNDAAFSSASWSHDGSRITLVREGKLQIHRADDGSLLRTIPPTDGAMTGPVAWSPTGEWIAVEGESSTGPSAGSRIELVRPDGSERVILTEKGGANVLPDNGAPQSAWSPDEERLTYANSELGGREADVFVARVAADGTAASNTRLTSDPASDAGPVFSPDGEWIAFISERGGENMWDLYRIRPDGSDLRQITDEGLSPAVRVPSWSADGRMLLSVTYNGTIIGARSGGEVVSSVLGSVSEPVVGVAWR